MVDDWRHDPDPKVEHMARKLQEAIDGSEHICWNSGSAVEASFAEIAKALLAAGWRPPE